MHRAGLEVAPVPVLVSLDLVREVGEVPVLGEELPLLQRAVHHHVDVGAAGVELDVVLVGELVLAELGDLDLEAGLLLELGQGPLDVLGPHVVGQGDADRLGSHRCRHHRHMRTGPAPQPRPERSRYTDSTSTRHPTFCHGRPPVGVAACVGSYVRLIRDARLIKSDLCKTQAFMICFIAMNDAAAGDAPIGAALLTGLHAQVLDRLGTAICGGELALDGPVHRRPGRALRGLPLGDARGPAGARLHGAGRASRRRVGTLIQPRGVWNVYDPQVIRWRLASDGRMAQLRSITELRPRSNRTPPGWPPSGSTTTRRASWSGSRPSCGPPGRPAT